MKKKELLALPMLRATRAMMKLAAEDTPVVTEYKDWWNGQVTHKSTYRFPLHLRSIERNGILKVAYFTVESMRLGGRLPIYELYLDRKQDDFLTYDRADGKWRTAKLDQLEWPTHIPYACKAKALPSDLKHIQRYFDTIIQLKRLNNPCRYDIIVVVMRNEKVYFYKRGSARNQDSQRKEPG